MSFKHSHLILLAEGRIDILKEPNQAVAPVMWLYARQEGVGTLFTQGLDRGRDLLSQQGPTSRVQRDKVFPFVSRTEELEVVS